ncbi:hypothetical protein GCM10011297_31440 [Bacterioplanes sanyensis]|uniref:sensor histidine kinase n=1 Tax=Bacterioplanes sanyensis TaxID=1249553 RepID=UPI001678527C|nr:histidine kinase [Bacterioplanes sanyensis]GGY56364.1 hypothetical protein GCM10011297_31440 [Bacterioplanes sanyensis]
MSRLNQLLNTRYWFFTPVWLLLCLATVAVVATPRLMHLTAQDKPWLLESMLHGLMLLCTLLLLNERSWNQRRLRAGILVIAAFVLAALMLQSISTIYLVYSIMLTSITTACLGQRASALFAGAVMLLFAVTHWLYWHNPELGLIVLLFGVFHGFAWVVSVQLDQEREQREQLQLSHAELHSTQALLSQTIANDERTHLARELHDQAGHQLTSLILQLDVARRQAQQSDNEALQQRLEQCYQQARDSLATIRQVVSDKRHSDIDLASALRDLCQHLPRVTVHLDIQPDAKLAQAKLAHCLLRCCQEAITNALKHSTTEQLWIRIASNDDRLTLRIVESEQALDLDLVGSTPLYGNGLTGLNERVVALNGQFRAVMTQQGLIVEAGFDD